MMVKYELCVLTLSLGRLMFVNIGGINEKMTHHAFMLECINFAVYYI
jgi:hypothetical protein